MSWKRQQTKQVFQCACRPRRVVSLFLPAVRRRVRYTVKGRLFGDVWTVSWPGDREMGIFHERSTVFLSAKISCLFPLPHGSSCPRHTSLVCDVWVDGSSWASSITFCVPEIFKVSWNKQNSIGLPLCGWRGLSPHSGPPCPRLRSDVLDTNTRPSEMTFSVVFVDILLLEVTAQNQKGLFITPDRKSVV